MRVWKLKCEKSSNHNDENKTEWFLFSLNCYSIVNGKFRLGCKKSQIGWHTLRRRERVCVCVRNKRQKGSEWMNKTESKEVVNQISYVRLAFRCRSFLWLVLTWIMIQCHLSTQIFVVIFIYLCVVCYIFFSRSFSFLKSVVWLTTIWQLILCLSHWLCISVSVSFVWSHFPKLLGISSVSSHYTCSRFCRYIFLFFIHFLSFSCFINIRQIGSVFFSSQINFICCGYGHKLSPYFKSWATFWLSLQHWDCHCCCRFVQST